MPNDCWNQLTLTAETPEGVAALARVRERLAAHAAAPNNHLRDSGWSFGAFVTPAGEVTHGWYSENMVAWGTMWEAYFVSTGEGATPDCDTYLHVTFYTAWSPPTAFMVALAAQYPELHMMLEFREPGANFEGWHEFGGGVLIGRLVHSCSVSDAESDDESDDESYADGADQPLTVAVAA
jgi:hypothetical protein